MADPVISKPAGVAAASGASGAILILVSNILWKCWGINFTGETWLAIGTILTSFVHWLPTCVLCQHLLKKWGLLPEPSVTISPAQAVPTDTKPGQPIQQVNA